MTDHEDFCAVILGYNWCTCIRYAEEQVARGFTLHMELSGQKPCGAARDMHALSAMPGHACPRCKAIV